MSKILALSALMLMLATSVATAGAQVSTGKGQPSSNANVLAQERATRNSDGGDREHGIFGQAQSSFVQDINAGRYDAEGWASFGDFLKEWKAENVQ